MNTAVVIVEDSQASLRRLKEAVNEIPGLQLVGSAPAAREAIELIANLRPAILILDLFLLEGSGVDVLQAVAEHGIPTQTIVVTSAPSETLTHACMTLGARFFFDKALEFEEFKSALRSLQQEAQTEGIV